MCNHVVGHRQAAGKVKRVQNETGAAAVGYEAGVDFHLITFF